jgi:hypothetical protein
MFGITTGNIYLGWLAKGSHGHWFDHGADDGFCQRYATSNARVSAELACTFSD